MQNKLHGEELMKLSWLKYFVLVVLLSALVACGGAEEPKPEPTEAPVVEEEPAAAEEEPAEEEPAVEEEPAEEEPAAEASATIVIWADDTRAPILASLAEGFQAEYGIALDVQQVPDINDQFPIAAPAGEGPDILILAHDRIGGFYASGLLAPIDLGGREGEFLDAAISAFTYEGELVGMPYAVENLGFFYNADYPFSEEAVEKVKKNDAAVDLLEKLAEAFASLTDWSEAKATIGATAKANGSKPGQLMFPTRVALSGMAGGPDLGAILDILGQEECVRRVKRAVTELS